MDTRENSLPLLPYLMIVFLVVFSILLDANVRNRAATSLTVGLWSNFVLEIDAKWIFGLLGALFVWVVARLGRSTTNGWVFIILGLVISAIPMLGVAGWLNLNEGFAFLRGDYLLSSAAMILAAGVLVLLSRIDRRKETVAAPESRQPQS